MTYHFLAITSQQASSLFDAVLHGEADAHDLIMQEAGWGEVVTSEFGPGDQPFSAALSLVGGAADGLLVRGEQAPNGSKVFQLADDVVVAVAEYGGAGSPESLEETDGSAAFGTVNAEATDNAGFLNALQPICRLAVDRGQVVCAIELP